MSLGKRLFIGEAAAAAVTSETVDIFGDSSGIALYSLDYDASDAGGNYDGTATDVTFGVDGHINWGASFNGSSGGITTELGNSQLSVSSAWSCSCWINSSSFSNATNILGMEDSASPYNGWSLYQNTIGNLQPMVNGNAVGTAKTLTANQWYNVVLTYSGTVLKFYVDGTQIGSDVTISISTPSSNFDIGGLGIYSVYSGKVDQVRIFQKALSQDEVDDLYEETACVYTPTTDTIDYQGTNVAYYKLDNNAEDETGNYDGTETNITYEFGRYGQAAVFNGSSSYITADKSMFGTGDGVANLWSISLWFKTDGSVTASRTLAGTKGGATQSGFLLYMISGGQIRYYEGNTSTNSQQLTTTTSYDDGNWHNVVITRSGTTDVFTMYIDGAEVIAPTTMTNPHTSHNFNLHIGRYPAAASLFWDGFIDQVRILDSALDATAVENLYNEKQAYITKNASDPFEDNSEEAFYKLENNANDSTGSNNGTWSGTPAYITGVFGQGADFNGTNRIDTGITSNYSNYTISLWAKKDAGGERYIIQKGYYTSSSNNNFTIIGQDGSGNLFVYNRLNATTNQNISGIIPNTGEWFHLVVTKDSSNVNTIYYNGVKQTTSSPSPANSTSDEWQIGGGNLSGNWDGGVDQVRIFDRVLDGDEVFKLYAEVIN